MRRAAVLLVSILLANAADAAETRKPTPLEKAFTAVALETGDHRICAKIAPGAETRVPFNSPGTRIYRERSSCYLYVALRTGNGALCAQVEEVRSLLLSGDRFSADRCRADVAAGLGFNASLGFDTEMLMRAVGYAEEDLRVPAGDGGWFSLYLDLLRDDRAAFIDRLLALPPSD